MMKLEKPDECVICIESLKDEQNSLCCGHWVHLECIKKQFKAECPLCRHPLNIQVTGVMPVDCIVPVFEEARTIVICDNCYRDFYIDEPCTCDNYDEDNIESEEESNEDNCDDYDEENPHGDNWNYENI
jgi:hypothetical protein